jgi:hypothetical protein
MSDGEPVLVRRLRETDGVEASSGTATAGRPVSL